MLYTAHMARKPKRKRKKRVIRINWNGCPPLPRSRRALRRAVRIALKKGCYVTATTNGTHATGSWHYSQHAVDFGSGSSANTPEKEAQAAIRAKIPARKIKELFGPLPWYIKNGVVYDGAFPGHGDHTHIAI